MLAFVGTALAFTLPPLSARAPPLTPHRAAPASMGLFDGLKKAFDNVDYSDSPATYEQTNARASHILVDDEAQVCGSVSLCRPRSRGGKLVCGGAPTRASSRSQIVSIKAQLDAGELDFSEAAVKFSKCKSAERGGKLGKFTPGTMVPEIDEIVFSVEDTGQINLGNGADIYAPKYEIGPIYGPVKSKLGYHLVKIEKRVRRAAECPTRETGWCCSSSPAAVPCSFGSWASSQPLSFLARSARPELPASPHHLPPAPARASGDRRLRLPRQGGCAAQGQRLGRRQEGLSADAGRPRCRRTGGGPYPPCRCGRANRVACVLRASQPWLVWAPDMIVW